MGNTPDLLMQFEVVRDFAGKLDDAGIPYMVTGSFALNLYAEPRMTRDVDVVIELEPGDERGIVRLFSTDFMVDEDAVREAILSARMFNMVHLKTLMKLDFIVRKKTTFEHNKFARRQRKSFDGIEAWVITKDDLILSKMVWTREAMTEKQLTDIRNLIRTGCDMKYIETWTRTLQLEAVLARARP